MSFQAVRAVFEAPVIAALADLDTPVPCYVDNQSFTIPDAGQEYATINLQFGQSTSKVLTGNLERLRGSLVIELLHLQEHWPRACAGDDHPSDASVERSEQLQRLFSNRCCGLGGRHDGPSILCSG